MKKTIFCLCFVVLCGELWSQSYHFSQFFSTPLLTNPANTGYMDGPTRFSSNLRSQGSMSNGFFTGYVSAEVNPLRNQLAMGYRAGIGVYAMNDRSLSGALQTNTIGLSAAYHVGLDTYGEQSIGLGVQGTYNQRRIDYSRLTFENQFGANGYDGSMPVGEPLDVDSRSFFDVNAGISYHVAHQYQRFFIGGAVYNILRHKENLLAEDFTMPMRFTVQSGFQLSLNDYESIYASITGMTQAKTTEITLGGAYGFKLDEKFENELIGGLWYRYKDAMIPYLGFMRTGFQVGLSYDYTTSAQKAGSQIKNAFELTLLYRAADKRELKTVIPWF